MTEGWGMVVAAAIALMGVLCGLFIGRRQVRDQAQVEHGQWLRGQRQEAYVNFLTVWDETIPKFADRVLDDEQLQYMDRLDSWDEANMSVVEGMEKDRKPLRQAAERVQMLGPEAVEQSVNAMLDTVSNLALGIGAQYVGGNQNDNLRVYWDAMGGVEPKRAVFLTASRNALRRTPDTGRS
ncbi:hypothetical protein QBA37_35425 [Streptomyces silvae]|uniref:Mammalian cell entry protein n=1 Tax=Streptomyces silvae TaxID=2803812 RepID=A0ABU8ADJ8_9ACTN